VSFKQAIEVNKRNVCVWFQCYKGGSIGSEQIGEKVDAKQSAGFVEVQRF
jgi:hypothetical protein